MWEWGGFRTLSPVMKKLLTPALFALAAASVVRAEPAVRTLEQISDMSPEAQSAALDGAKYRSSVDADGTIHLTKPKAAQEPAFQVRPEPMKKYMDREAVQQERRERENDPRRFPPTARGVEATAPDWAIMAAMGATLVLMILFISI